MHKTTIKLLPLLALPLLMGSIRAGAAAPDRDTLIRKVCFVVNSPALENESRTELDSLVSLALRKDSTEVQIWGWSSPEGPSRQNRRLSKERAEAVRNYIGQRLPVKEENIHYDGVDWNGYLKALESNEIDMSENLADIISNTPEWVTDSKGKVIDGRVARLKRLGNGTPWKESSEKIFPGLRRTDVIVAFKKETPKQAKLAITEIIEPVMDTVKTVTSTIDTLPATGNINEPADTVIVAEPIEESKPARKPGFVLTSNLLYDIALIPNLGTQFHLGKGWAVDTRWGYNWLANDEANFYFRIYGGELSIRKYLGKGPYESRMFTSLTGHHLGIYGQVFTYDIEFGNGGQIGGTPKMNIFDNPQYGFGLEYGYTIPLNESFNLDLSIGAGYVGGIYHEYEPFHDKYMWTSTYQRNWFGPTKIGVTLHWLIGGAKKEVAR